MGKGSDKASFGCEVVSSEGFQLRFIVFEEINEDDRGCDEEKLIRRHKSDVQNGLI